MKTKIILLLGLVLSFSCPAAIVYPKAPDGGREMVAKNLDLKFLGVSRREEITIAEPCREYFAGASNLVQGHLLMTVKPDGWRYLLSHGTDTVGTAQLNADDGASKGLRFNSIQKPFFPDAIPEALRMAVKLPQIKTADYELRYLDVNHHFMMVWLHGKADDILIPLPPTFAPLKEYQPYSEGEIIRLLKPDAEKTLKNSRKFN
jgi:hypothetical protein